MYHRMFRVGFIIVVIESENYPVCIPVLVVGWIYTDAFSGWAVLQSIMIILQSSRSKNSVKSSFLVSYFLINIM